MYIILLFDMAHLCSCFVSCVLSLGTTIDRAERLLTNDEIAMFRLSWWEASDDSIARNRSRTTTWHTNEIVGVRQGKIKLGTVWNGPASSDYDLLRHDLMPKKPQNRLGNHCAHVSWETNTNTNVDWSNMGWYQCDVPGHHNDTLRLASTSSYSYILIVL
jgi:hypothetical protein